MDSKLDSAQGECVGQKTYGTLLFPYAFGCHSIDQYRGSEQVPALGSCPVS